MEFSEFFVCLHKTTDNTNIFLGEIFKFINIYASYVYKITQYFLLEIKSPLHPYRPQFDVKNLFRFDQTDITFQRFIFTKQQQK